MRDILNAAREFQSEQWVVARVRTRGDDPSNYLVQVAGRNSDMVARSSGSHVRGDEVLLTLRPNQSIPGIVGASPWRCSSTAMIAPATNPDGSDITVSDIYGLRLAPRFRQEVPDGTVDGSNVAFTLAYRAIPGTAVVTVNGLDVTPDVVVSGRAIVFAAAPLATDTLYVDYIQARVP